MRLKLDLPSSLPFSFNIPVRISDINYGNHAGNDSMVSILHEARMQWLKSYGYTELDIEGTGLIMSDIQVEFKSESFYGDILLVKMGIGEISSVSFELFYELTVRRNFDEHLIAKAKTGLVCYDYIRKKVTSIPAVFLDLLMANVGG